MIRRDFLRRSAATIAGASVALTGVDRVLAGGRWVGAGELADSFSLDVVTGSPTDILNSIGSFLSENRQSSGNVKVQIMQLVGEHVSDAVFVRNGQLVDYRVEGGPVELFLGDLSRQFEFRKSTMDPSLIRFSGGALAQSGPARIAQFYAGDLLVRQRALNGDHFEETLESRHGHVFVRYDESGVRIVDATCKHKTCVKAGAVSIAGESLVCIPARLRVVMAGEAIRADGVHVVSQ